MPSSTIRTLNFLTPSLHPNTLVDLSFPEPDLGPSSSLAEPIVTHLPIKYGTHASIGSVKRMLKTGENEIVVADDKFQISKLSLPRVGEENPAPPEVTWQSGVKARSKDIWAGLVPVEGCVLSGLTSGLLTLHPTNATSEASTSSRTRTVPSPLTCIASTPLAPNQFAMGGKEVDVSVWDVERTFGGSGDIDMAGGNAANDKGKRKKDALLPGQIWQAKNVPSNNLSLRQPIHHLCLTYLPSSSNLLVSGTKQGTVRRFDTRQRKPLSDWKVAREGGVGSVQPGAVEHELFFADRSNLLGALDLRTGKVLYTYSKLTSTPHQLLAIPPSTPDAELEPATLRLGLASLALDATFRLHSSTTPPTVDHKGNWGGEGKKGSIVGMAGAIGVGEGIWRGWGERTVERVRKVRKEGEEGEDDDDDSQDEEVWEGMDAVEDQGEDSDEDEEDESEEEEEEEQTRRSVTKRAKRS